MISLVFACAFSIAAADEPAPAPAPAPAPVAPAPVAPTPLAAPAAREKVLVLDVAGEEAVAERRGLADALASIFLEKSALDVAPASAVRDRLALVADRTETGCDASSCASEAADAIGARYVLFSRLSALEGVRTLRLEVLDSRDARAVSVVVVRGDSLTSLSLELPRAVDELIERSDGVLTRRDAPAPIIEAPGFFDRAGNGALVAGFSLVGIGVLAGIGWGIPAFIGGQREAVLGASGDTYREEPSIENANDVVAARAEAAELRPVQLLTSPLFLVAGACLAGGGAFVVAGIVEKAE